MSLQKVIVAPDSFKGSLSAGQAADIIAQEIKAHYPSCEAVKLPLADGGEGSIEAILAAMGGRLEAAQVLSPDSREITAHFGVTPQGLAILEMAESSGLTKQIGLHPMTANTFGFGQLILRALELGLREFYLCIGGSATTDGGCGMAAALGVRFMSEAGVSFIPCGATLARIASVDTSGIDARILASNFTVLCDVTNPLYGSSGAARVYAPQKGANPEEVKVLDNGLCHLSSVFRQNSGTDYSKLPGAGAAGGLGFGCMALLGAQQISGIQAVLDLYDFKKQLIDADLIITGEGRLDDSSFMGKTLAGILQNSGSVPVVSICGVSSVKESLLEGYDLSVFEMSSGISTQESLENPERHLRRTVSKVLSSLA